MTEVIRVCLWKFTGEKCSVYIIHIACRHILVCKLIFLTQFLKNIFYISPPLIRVCNMGRPPLNWTCLGATETILTLFCWSLIIHVFWSENFLFVSLDVGVKDSLFDMSAGANFYKAPPPLLVVAFNSIPFYLYSAKLQQMSSRGT